jgi:hypothetical protein
MAKFLYRIEILQKEINMFGSMTSRPIKKCFVYDTTENAYKYMKYLIDVLTVRRNDSIKIENYVKCELSEYCMRYQSVNLYSTKDIKCFYEGEFLKETSPEIVDTAIMDSFYQPILNI